MKLFATCVAGLEPILGQELRDLGMDEVRPLTGGVSFAANLEGAYTALLWSRVASRILLIVGHVDASNSDTLYDGVRQLAWEEHVSEHATIAISARGTSDELRDTRFTALRVKDGICDRLRELRGARPDVDPKNPDVRIQVNLRARRATIYVDLSGTSLEDRGYRHAAKSTSSVVHETLAAALLLAANWPGQVHGGTVLVDDMCAAGTVVIEGAMMAADIAPGLTRSSWGFTGWVGHDEGLWSGLLDRADQRAQEASRNRVIFAADDCGSDLACAKTRAKSAGVAALIEFADSQDVLWQVVEQDSAQRALFASSLFAAVDASESTLPARYAKVAASLLAQPKLTSAAVLVDGEDADAFLGLERVKGYGSMNGSAACDIALYDLSVGSSMQDVATVRDHAIAVHDAAAQQFADRLNKMCKQRRKWAAKEGVFAYRVYDADLPDYNMAIDLYEGAGNSEGRRVVHVAEYAPPKKIDAMKAARRMTDALNIIQAVFAIPAQDVFVKRRMRSRGGSQYAKAGQMDRSVDPLSPLVTRESGLLFEVDMASYLDTGLFLDHRDVRRLVGTLARGKSFLNLFAYTCTASVYAAAGGATFTTSVDLSNTYLDWGRRNMELNGLMNGHQEFVRADCVEWVSNTRHSKMRWDLIFVDPPTFSNSSKMGQRTWDVQRDHAELLIGVSRLLTRGGAAVFSCNLRGFKIDAAKLAKAGVQVVDITDKTIPLDFERHANVHHCFVLRRI